MSPDVATHVDWYRRMLEIRLFEEKVQELFMEGLIEGTTHLCQGQEAVCGRRDRGAAGRRLPDDHLPRPRARARARHADGGVLRRADGPVDRLLRGRRRLDALHRRRAGAARRVRDRRRGPARSRSAPRTRRSSRGSTRRADVLRRRGDATSGRSTRRSTWRPRGRSASSSSSRTTSTASTRRCATRRRSTTSPSARRRTGSPA